MRVGKNLLKNIKKTNGVLEFEREQSFNIANQISGGFKKLVLDQDTRQLKLYQGDHTEAFIVIDFDNIEEVEFRGFLRVSMSIEGED